jgi:hypothetical protein
MTRKPKPKPDEIEEFPDAWGRFEKAFDTVMKAKPMPRKTEKPKAIDVVARTPVRRRSSGNCGIQLRLDADAALEVIAKFKSEFDLDLPGDARKRVLSLLERPEEAFRVETDVGAAGARKVTVRLNPSDRLIELLAALRAGNIDRLAVEKA